MIQTQGVVVRIEGHEAWVEAMHGGGCGNCSSANGCGSGKAAQLFCSEPRRYRVRNDANAPVGAFVQIALPDGALLQSALLMYVLPLFLLLLGAIAGTQAAPATADADQYALLGGMAGLVAGFLAARLLSGKRRLRWIAQPAILPSSAVDSGVI